MSAKKALFVGLLLLTFGLTYYFVEFPVASRTNTTQGEVYKVDKVVDGDTLEITRYGRSEKIRLIGIDTPETVNPRKPQQCFGAQASDYTKSLLTGRSVRLEFDPVVGERDKYNRLLAYVWLDEKMVNDLLVSGGYAHEYTYRSQAYKYQTQFKQAESSARQNELGFWSKATCGGVTK